MDDEAKKNYACINSNDKCREAVKIDAEAEYGRTKNE